MHELRDGFGVPGRERVCDRRVLGVEGRGVTVLTVDPRQTGPDALEELVGDRARALVQEDVVETRVQFDRVAGLAGIERRPGLRDHRP